MALEIAAYDNLGVPTIGATVVISGSGGATNLVEYLTPQFSQWKSSGVVLQGDGAVNVPNLDVTMLYMLRVRSENVSQTLSNVVLCCPTNGFYSEQTNILIGIQQQVASLNLAAGDDATPAIGIKVYRAEDVQQVLGTSIQWPAIVLQKDGIEQRKTLDNQRTNWRWPVALTIVDRVGSPTDRDEIHNAWRYTIINALDRLPCTFYPKCKRIDIEPGYIQGSAYVGGRDDSAATGGYNVWCAQLKLWCETDLLIGRYIAAQTAAVVAGGSGYNVGDQITLAGGVADAPAVATVRMVANGAVTLAQVTGNGFYGSIANPGIQATPTNPVVQASTTGGGSGATFNVTWAQ